MPTADAKYSSPLHKILAFLERSRDGWKSKHHAVQDELRKLKHQLRAVEASRRQWRDRARAAEEAGEIRLPQKVTTATN